jgi:hypothetical protein
VKAKEPSPRRRPGSRPDSRVNVYYNSRSTAAAETSPFEKRQPKKLLRSFLIRSVDFLFFAALIAGLLWSLLVGSTGKVSLNDTTYHSKKDYATFIDSKLGEFGNRNKISFDEASLKQSITKAFPEVVTVGVELPLIGQQPVFTLNVAPPAFFIRSGGDEYLLSGNGVAVDLKSDYPKLAGLPTIDDESGFVISKGKHVLSQQDINFLQSVAAQLNHQKVPIKKLTLPSSPEEADLYTNDAGYYTKFFMGGDAGTQIGQYSAARNSFKTQTPPDSYLDVRVAGKVFYK